MSSYPNRGMEDEPEDSEAEGITRLLLLADGTVLAHNLTPQMAQLLQELAPDDSVLRERHRLTGGRIEDVSQASPLSAGT